MVVTHTVILSSCINLDLFTTLSDLLIEGMLDYIFSGHYSELTFTHLIKGIFIEEIMLVKRTYAWVNRDHDIKKTKHHRAVNLSFNNKSFKDECDLINQTCLYCCV